MTGVRSFDIKAYDNTLANYADLGWGDDLRRRVHGRPLLAGQSRSTPVTATPSIRPWLRFKGTTWHSINTSFAHEGRMPPLIEDNRLDAQFPNPTYVTSTSFVQQYPNITLAAPELLQFLELHRAISATTTRGSCD